MGISTISDESLLKDNLSKLRVDFEIFCPLEDATEHLLEDNDKTQDTGLPVYEGLRNGTAGSSASRVRFSNSFYEGRSRLVMPGFPELRHDFHRPGGNTGAILSSETYKVN